jgi:hypothetical protein
MAEEAQSPPRLPEFIMARSIPEFYVDQFRVNYSSYTVMLSFGVGAPGQPTRDEVILRMSPEHAKVMAILFKKSFKAFEEERGAEVTLPPSVLEEHKLSLERDW